MNASVLYLIVCAAPPAQKIHEFVVPAKYMGWDVCVIATPQATRFLDIGVPTFFPGVFPAKRTAIAVQGAKKGFRDVLETKIHVGVGWKPFISSGKAPFPPALVLKEACKHPFFRQLLSMLPLPSFA